MLSRTFLLITCLISSLPLAAMEAGKPSPGKEEEEDVIQSTDLKRELSSDEEGDNPAPSKKQKIKSGKEEVFEDEDYSDNEFRQSDIELTDSDQDEVLDDHQLVELPHNFITLLQGDTSEENLFNAGISRKKLLERLLRKHYNIDPKQILWLLGYNKYSDDEQDDDKQNCDRVTASHSPFSLILRKGASRNWSVPHRTDLHTDKADHAKPSLAVLKKHYATVDKTTALRLLEELFDALESNTDLNNSKSPHINLYAAHFDHICTQLLAYKLDDQEKQSLANLFSNFLFNSAPHPLLLYYYGRLKLPITNRLLCAFTNGNGGNLEYLSIILANNPVVDLQSFTQEEPWFSIINRIMRKKAYHLLSFLQKQNIRLPIESYIPGDNPQGCQLLQSPEGIYQLWQAGIDDLLQKKPGINISYINTLLATRQNKNPCVLSILLFLFPFQYQKYHANRIPELVRIFKINYLPTITKKMLDILYDILTEGGIRLALLERAHTTMLTHGSFDFDLDDIEPNYSVLEYCAKTMLLGPQGQPANIQQSAPSQVPNLSEEFNPDISITTLLRHREMHDLKRKNLRLITYKNKNERFQ